MAELQPASPPLMAETKPPTELDATEVLQCRVTFDSTLLGKPPNELLQNIVRHLSRSELLAVTLVSSRLRALAEKRLYTNIQISYISDFDEWYATGEGTVGCLWRTLSGRSDLATWVKNLELVVEDLDHYIKVPASSVFAGGLPFTSDLNISISEPMAAGVLLQQVTEIKSLVLLLVRPEHERKTDEDLMPRCMDKLFPGFDCTTAHTKDLSMLQKVEDFAFYGDEIHWIMARGPHLRMLRLMHPCKICADAAPHEINPALKVLTITFRSSLLNPSIDRYDTLIPFLKHFPSLERLILETYDRNPAEIRENIHGDLGPQQQGTFSLVLAKIRPLALMLTTLDLCVHSRGDLSVLDYLHHALPGGGFLAFTALKVLCVPYACLLGAAEPAWSYDLPPMTETLPCTLERLHVCSAEIRLYDWLAQLPRFRTDLPELSFVEIHCDVVIGDSYEIFAFESYPHQYLQLYVQ